MTAIFLAMLLTGAGGLAEMQVLEPPPAAAPAQRAELQRDHFIEYFTPADYPAGALQRDTNTWVWFRVAIAADGRVTDCVITRPSISPAIDRATCRVIMARARYRPALDAAGRPMADTDHGIIDWYLPAERGAAIRFLVPPPVPVMAPLPPPPPRVVPPQRARANLNSYFTEDDYPALALRANHQGMTAFRLTIGTDGRVAACEVTSSSNSEPLDQATCRILRSRARYIAARDENGAPTTGIDSGRVTWRLPGDIPDRAGVPQAYRPARWLSGEVDRPGAADYPPGAPPPVANDGESELRVAIGREGQVVACDIAMSSGSPALDAEACRLYAARVRFEPARDPAGAAICDVTWESVNWGPAAAARAPAPRGTRPPAARPPRPLGEQLNARLCPGWPEDPLAPLLVSPPSPPRPSPPPPAGRPLSSLLSPSRPGRAISPPQRLEPDLQAYFTTADYPATALRNNEQGTTFVRLLVGANGSVSGCTVTGSSGSAALDAATCRVLRLRARYLPARTAVGMAIDDTDPGMIVWRLPPPG